MENTTVHNYRIAKKNNKIQEISCMLSDRPIFEWFWSSYWTFPILNIFTHKEEDIPKHPETEWELLKKTI